MHGITFYTGSLCRNFSKYEDWAFKSKLKAKVYRPTVYISTTMYHFYWKQYHGFKKIVQFFYHFQVPANTEEWLNIADGFNSKWNFPNCVGSLDGKHVVIQCPEFSGSFYYNYKNSHSIVLLALVDSNYKFIFVDVGCNGRISDGGVFSRSALSSALEDNRLSIPDSSCLPGSDVSAPYVIVADNAFPLRRNIMKPFPFRNQPAPNRVFNYRLSRARRVVENAFGILSQVFRIFRRPILLAPAKVESIVLAACCLHNFLLDRSKRVYAPEGVLDSESGDGSQIPGSWRNDPPPNRYFFPIDQQGSNSHSDAASAVRSNLRDYFMSPEGELPWQYSHIWFFILWIL